jgi:antitoxin VapB
MMSAMTRTAKLFINGRSQAVRLPADFRFDGSEVFIRRDLETGDVILSKRPPDWNGFFAAVKRAKVPPDFLDRKERAQVSRRPDPFDGWQE